MKRLVGLAVACLVVMAGIAPALADNEEKLTIINNSSFGIVAVSIKPGKVMGSKAIASRSKKTFTIVVPDGVCDVQMITTFDDGVSDKNDIEVCGGMTFTWTDSRF